MLVLQLFPDYFSPLPECVSGAALSQSADDLDVGDGADDDREEELSAEEEDPVDSPPGPRPLLVAVRPALRGTLRWLRARSIIMSYCRRYRS